MRRGVRRRGKFLSSHRRVPESRWVPFPPGETKPGIEAAGAAPAGAAGSTLERWILAPDSRAR